MQAVMNSDYEIAQFRFLQNLLFVHGAWSYRRLSVLILFSFYKSVSFSLCQVWFGFFSGWSGQPFYDPWTASFFNFLFTGAPILVVTIFNRDYTYEQALKYPPLYRDGQEDRTFNIALFIGYFGEGIMHSLLIFIFSLRTMPEVMTGNMLHLPALSDFWTGSTTTYVENNQAVDLWTVSSTTYAACFYVCTFKLCLLTKTWTFPILALFLLQFGVWFLYMYIYSRMYFISPNMYGLANQLFASLHHWLVIFIICSVTMIPELSLEFIRREFWPSRVELLQYYQEEIEASKEIMRNRRKEHDIEAARKEIEKKKRPVLRPSIV